MMVIGNTIKDKVKENILLNNLEIFMKVIGKMIKEKVKVYLVGVMAVYMRDNGVTVSSMVREFS